MITPKIAGKEASKESRFSVHGFQFFTTLNLKLLNKNYIYLLHTLGVSAKKQAEILPSEPDLVHTSVGKSKMTSACIFMRNCSHS
jgi:hypothetical protein